MNPLVLKTMGSSEYSPSTRRNDVHSPAIERRLVPGSLASWHVPGQSLACLKSQLAKPARHSQSHPGTIRELTSDYSLSPQPVFLLPKKQKYACPTVQICRSTSCWALVCDNLSGGEVPFSTQCCADWGVRWVSRVATDLISFRWQEPCAIG